MKTIIVLKPFKFAHEGIHVEEFTPSDDPIETTDECAELAIGEKWAKAYKEPKQKKPGDDIKPATDGGQKSEAEPQGNEQAAEDDQSVHSQSAEADANTPE